MPASIYLYENLDEYMLFYPPFQPRETESPIVNFYLNKPYGVWVVVNVENKLGPGSYKASLNVILDGMKGFAKMAQGNNDLVKLDRSEISYNFKHNQIIFKNDDFVKQFTVQRYVGTSLSKGRFRDWISPTLPISGFAFFDYSRNRINMILGEIHSKPIESVEFPTVVSTPFFDTNNSSSQEKTIVASNPDHISS